MPTIGVIIERGTKRVFASAADWPGWARSGKDEGEALAALLAYAPRYARIAKKLGFAPPKDISDLHVVERTGGNATTDFGAPGVPAKIDAAKVGDADLARLYAALDVCWRAFDATVAKARGKALAKGPRGGGRTLDKIAAHVYEAELAYLSGLGAPFKSKGSDLTAERAAVREALAASARGEIPAKGPRGGLRWKPRYFVRRAMWHTLDHLWEIEDRS
ncbi:MAG TPA: hypothetical protein VEU77_12980 [Candidatus Acidoferrales bacterium]|nr:hypothetical protein [Candidatus Acidoferrales bacterium]